MNRNETVLSATEREAVSKKTGAVSDCFLVKVRLRSESSAKAEVSVVADSLSRQIKKR